MKQKRADSLQQSDNLFQISSPILTSAAALALRASLFFLFLLAGLSVGTEFIPEFNLQKTYSLHI